MILNGCSSRCLNGHNEAFPTILTGYDAIWGGPTMGVAWVHMKTRSGTLEIDVQPYNGIGTIQKETALYRISLQDDPYLPENSGKFDGHLAPDRVWAHFCLLYHQTGIYTCTQEQLFFWKQLDAFSAGYVRAVFSMDLATMGQDTFC